MSFSCLYVLVLVCFGCGCGTAVLYFQGVQYLFVFCCSLWFLFSLCVRSLIFLIEYRYLVFVVFFSRVFFVFVFVFFFVVFVTFCLSPPQWERCRDPYLCHRRDGDNARIFRPWLFGRLPTWGHRGRRHQCLQSRLAYISTCINLGRSLASSAVR